MSDNTLNHMESKTEQKVNKAKGIIAEIFNLIEVREGGFKPNGYGNYELNKATDAMYDYIKTIQENDYAPLNKKSQ